MDFKWNNDTLQILDVYQHDSELSPENLLEYIENAVTIACNEVFNKQRYIQSISLGLNEDNDGFDSIYCHTAAYTIDQLKAEMADILIPKEPTFKTDLFWLFAKYGKIPFTPQNTAIMNVVDTTESWEEGSTYNYYLIDLETLTQKVYQLYSSGLSLYEIDSAGKINPQNPVVARCIKQLLTTNSQILEFQEVSGENTIVVTVPHDNNYISVPTLLSLCMTMNHIIYNKGRDYEIIHFHLPTIKLSIKRN